MLNDPKAQQIVIPLESGMESRYTEWHNCLR